MSQPASVTVSSLDEPSSAGLANTPQVTACSQGAFTIDGRPVYVPVGEAPVSVGNTQTQAATTVDEAVLRDLHARMTRMEEQLKVMLRNAERLTPSERRELAHSLEWGGQADVLNEVGTDIGTGA